MEEHEEHEGIWPAAKQENEQGSHNSATAFFMSFMVSTSFLHWSRNRATFAWLSAAALRRRPAHSAFHAKGTRDQGPRVLTWRDENRSTGRGSPGGRRSDTRNGSPAQNCPSRRREEPGPTPCLARLPMHFHP